MFCTAHWAVPENKTTVTWPWNDFGSRASLKRMNFIPFLDKLCWKRGSHRAVNLYLGYMATVYYKRAWLIVRHACVPRNVSTSDVWPDESGSYMTKYPSIARTVSRFAAALSASRNIIRPDGDRLCWNGTTTLCNSIACRRWNGFRRRQKTMMMMTAMTLTVGCAATRLAQRTPRLRPGSPMTLAANHPEGTCCVSLDGKLLQRRRASDKSVDLTSFEIRLKPCLYCATRR